MSKGLRLKEGIGIVIRGDVNGADNIRQKAITTTPPLVETATTEDSGRLCGSAVDLPV